MVWVVVVVDGWMVDGLGWREVVKTREVDFRPLNVRFTPSKVEKRVVLRSELYNISKAQLLNRSGGSAIVKTSFNGDG